MLPGGGLAADSEVPSSCISSNYCVCEAVAAALVSGIGRLLVLQTQLGFSLVVALAAAAVCATRWQRNA